MSHRVEDICRYGALQENSTDTHEQPHKPNFKDAFNTSNHNLNYLPQVITVQRHIHCIKVREQNLQVLTQGRENSIAACKVLTSSANLDAALSPQSYAQPVIMRPQNCHDGNHPGAMINDF